MWSGVSKEIKDCIVKRIPLGRFGTPQEVARAARFLIVDAIILHRHNHPNQWGNVHALVVTHLSVVTVSWTKAPPIDELI